MHSYHAVADLVLCFDGINHFSAFSLFACQHFKKIVVSAVFYPCQNLGIGYFIWYGFLSEDNLGKTHKEKQKLYVCCQPYFND